MGLFGGKKGEVQQFTGTKPVTSLKQIPEGQIFSDELIKRLAGLGTGIPAEDFTRIIAPVRARAAGEGVGFRPEAIADILKPIEERISGIDVGFRPEVISAATAPFATARRAAVREIEAPAIRAVASAAGLGRSTIPVGQIAQAGTTAERDISQRIADLSLQNEIQRRAEINQAFTERTRIKGGVQEQERKEILDAENARIELELKNELQKRIETNDALARLGVFTVDEANQRNKAAEFEFKSFLNELGQRQAIEAEQQAGVGRLITLATTLAGGIIGGPAGAFIGAKLGSIVTGTSNSGLTDILGILGAGKSLLSPTQSATVAGGGTVTSVGATPGLGAGFGGFS